MDHNLNFVLCLEDDYMTRRNLLNDLQYARRMRIDVIGAVMMKFELRKIIESIVTIIIMSSLRTDQHMLLDHFWLKLIMMAYKIEF